MAGPSVWTGPILARGCSGYMFHADSGRRGRECGPPSCGAQVRTSRVGRDDGAVVDYADIEAELAGGTISTRTMLSLPVETPFELVSGAATASLDQCEPGCELDRGSWNQAKLHVASLTASGTVEDPTAFDRLGGETRSWTLTLSPSAFSRAMSAGTRSVSNSPPLSSTPETSVSRNSRAAPG